MTGVEDLLCPADGLHEEWFEDGILIWDETRALLHHLDLRAALVWSLLDGRSLGQAAAELAQELGAAPGVVQQDVLTLGRRLRSRGLLRPCDA